MMSLCIALVCATSAGLLHNYSSESIALQPEGTRASSHAPYEGLVMR